MRVRCKNIQARICITDSDIQQVSRLRYECIYWGSAYRTEDGEKEAKLTDFVICTKK